MSADRKEIDLIIKAQLKGGKTIEGVTQSINDLEKALLEQAAAAKRGEASIDELRATLLSLQQVQDRLKDQAALIGQYQRLSDGLQKAADKAAAASTKHAEFKAKLDATGKATDAQAEKLLKYAKSAERAEQSLASQRDQQQKLATVLKDAGVELDKVGESQKRVQQTAAQLGITINKTHEAISTYSEDVRRARLAERELAAESAFKKKLQDADNLVRASASIRIWEQSLKGANIAEQQVRINDALRQTADAAVAAARGYKTLGTAAKSFGDSSNGLRGVVDGILDPAAQARKTLDGVEQEILDIGKAVSSINGPLSQYRETIQKLSAAQKEITGQASMVDQFSKQVIALRQSRAEFSAARAQVLQYADALRRSGRDNADLSASLSRAQADLVRARNNLQSQIDTTRQMRGAMRDAGIATGDLAAAQSRLANAARSSVSSMEQLRSAHQRYGDAVRNSAQATDFFNSNGRTTLSFLQRLRGELLALGAAYVGVYGAVRGARSAIEAFNSKIALQNQLAVAVGNDSRAIGDAYKYIHEQAERLGLDFEKAGPQFATFSAAAKLAGRTTEETRFIFEAFAETGTVLNLSSAKMEKVFFALQQMMSKGKISAEELNQQLGDGLPGAFGLVQEALRDKFPDLAAAMKEGQVGVENLVAVAEHLREVFGERLPTAIKSLQANQNRLNTALFDFKVMVAEAGFADEFAKLVESLTTFFKSDDGKQFAKDLADGLILIIKGLRLIVENAEIVKTILISGVFIFGARSAVQFGIAISKLPAKIAQLTAAANGASLAVRGLNTAFALVSAFIVGWNIGTILREKFAIVRQAAVGLIVFFDLQFTTLKYLVQIVLAEIPAFFVDMFATIGNVLTKGFREMLRLFSTAARAIGKNELADSIDKVIETNEFKVDHLGNASAKLRAQMEKDLKAIVELGADMIEFEGSRGSIGPDGKPIGTTPKPTVTPDTKLDEEAAKKRAQIRESLESELRSIEAKIERNDKDSLTRRLNAIDIEYQTLLNKIRKFGGAEGAAMEVRLMQDTTALKVQETKKFNDALLKEQLSLQKKLEAIDVQAGRGQKTDMEARLAAVAQAHEDTYREIAEFRERLLADDRDTAPADLMRGRLDAGIVQLQNLEKQKVLEEQVNSVLEERKAKLELIRVQQENGLLTQQQAFEKSSEVIGETQPKIEAIVDAGLEYVKVMREAAIATGASVQALDTLEAKLLAAKNSAKGLRTELFSVAQVDEMIADGLVGAFEKMADAIGDAINNVHSWGDAWRVARNAFLQFAADFLMQIGKMIAQQILLNMLKNSPIGGWISGAGNALVKHRGGLVNGSGPRRAVDPAWFANAPRFHGGGVVGLGPNEVPIIARKNEEVLTENDPRNVMNGGGSQGQPAQQHLKIINMIDSGSVVSEGLSTEPGRKAFFNFIQANRSSMKQILA